MLVAKQPVEQFARVLPDVAQRLQRHRRPSLDQRRQRRLLRADRQLALRVSGATRKP